MIFKKAVLNNNGAREMGFGSWDGVENDENNGISFVGIFKIYVTADTFCV